LHGTGEYIVEERGCERVKRQNIRRKRRGYVAKPSKRHKTKRY
jgi:hypothetical protein